MSYRIAPDLPGHPDYEVWRGSRALGASLAEVVWRGRDKWQTAHQAWLYLTKRADKPPMSAAAQEGLDREPEIIRAWEAYVGMAGEDADLIDGEHDFLRCQVDWISYDGTRACDAKLTRSKENWAKIDKLSLYRTALMEGDPWWFAAQHQLMILGLPMVDYYIFDGTSHFVHLIAQRDEEHIAKYRQRCIDWWECHVVKDLPPPPAGRKLKLIPDLKEK